MRRGAGGIACLAFACLAFGGPLESTARAEEYAPCGELQATVVHGRFIDYQSALIDVRLARCAALFEHAPRERSVAAQVAFWVNAYNFLTLKAVALARPEYSVRDGGAPIFSHEKVRADGRWLTLDEIEHQELARLGGDPRLALLLHCGTRDCAPLPERPLEEAGLEAQIEAALQRFFADPRNLRLGASDADLVLSHLLHPDWDGGPLAARYGSILDFAALHGPAALHLADRKARRISYRDYDWRLDAQRSYYPLP